MHTRRRPVNLEASPGNATLLALLTAAIAACSSTAPMNAASGATSGSGGSSASSTSSASSSGQGGASSASGSQSSSSSGTGGAPSKGSSGSGGTGGVPSARRPFLVGSSLRSAAAARRADWSADVAPVGETLAPATRGLLAESWLKDALEEHASVAAFARFTMHLLAVGAPSDLVQRSQRASLDEIRHARACFALARRYGAGDVGPGLLAVHDALGALSLAEVAALAAEEGCVGETLGSVLAREQLAVAKDPAVADMLGRIAEDEARHAELAWRFAAWAIQVGGAEVERAVHAAAERAIGEVLAIEVRTYDDIDVDAFHAHGRLTCQEARAATERALREVVRPCLARLLRRELVEPASPSA